MNSTALRTRIPLAVCAVAAVVAGGLTVTSAPVFGDGLTTPTTIDLAVPTTPDGLPDDSLVDETGATDPVDGVVQQITDALPADPLGEGEEDPDPGPDPDPDPDPGTDPGEDPGTDPGTDPEVIEPSEMPTTAGPWETGKPGKGKKEKKKVASDEEEKLASVERHLNATRRLSTDAASPKFSYFGEYQAGMPWGAMDYFDVPRGPRSTGQILDLLAQANATPVQTAQVLVPFPVNGPAQYGSDWGAPRFYPEFHTHEGVDIFAGRGTPVIASGAGEISRITLNTDVGGNTVYLTMADGTYYYYAHLDRIAPALEVGLEVEAGTVLGTVGTSGNARGTPPHLHFEIHPGGGGPVPPHPYLDGWLSDALLEAQALAAGGQLPTTRINAGVPVPNAPIVQAPLPPLLAGPASLREDATTSPAVMLLVLGALVLVWRKGKWAVALVRERVELPEWLHSKPEPVADILADYLERVANGEIGRLPEVVEMPADDTVRKERRGAPVGV